MKNKKKIGDILLDTGVLLLGDIINLREFKQSEFKKTTKLRNKNTNEIYEYGKDFKKFTDLLFDNKTVNELIETKIIEEIKDTNETELSLDNIVNDIEQKNFKQLRFDTGINGKALAVLNMNGEGFYPVYAEYNDKGIERLIIEFKEEDENINENDL